jgi:hypothetical protein
MQQSEEESLEDYLERFLYNYQKTKQFSLDTTTVRTIFLKGIRDGYIEVLNLMSSGDVYQNPFKDIVEYCKRYSSSQAKTGKSIRDPMSKTTKLTLGGVTRIELGNLLEKFKIDILNTIITQLDTMKVKRKQQEENATLAIFCPGVGKGIQKNNFLLMSLKFVGFVQRTTLPMSSLTYLYYNPFSREEGNLRKHHIPLREHGDNKILICFSTLPHNTHNNNGFLQFLTLNGHISNHK